MDDIIRFDDIEIDIKLEEPITEKQYRYISALHAKNVECRIIYDRYMKVFRQDELIELSKFQAQELLGAMIRKNANV